MDKTQIERIQATSGAIYTFANRLDYNAEIFTQYDAITKCAMDQYNLFHGQINNEEEFKKLSPPEQQTLFENTRNYADFIDNLHKELTYLSRSRHSLNIITAMDELGAINMLLNALIDLMGGPSGKLVYPDIHIKDKHWNKATYNNQVVNLEIEVDKLVLEVANLILADKQLDATIRQALIFNTYTSLVKAQAWLNNEIDRVEHDGMPKAREFNLPEIVVPKLPDQKDQPKKG